MLLHYDLCIRDTFTTCMDDIHRMLRVRLHLIILTCTSFISDVGEYFSLIESPFLLEVSTKITCPYFGCCPSVFPVRFGTPYV